MELNFITVIIGLNIIGSLVNLILSIRTKNKVGSLGWFSATLGWVVAMVQYLQ